MAYAIGIDLGTTNSVISVCRRRVPETVHIDGRSTLPSVVSFRDNGSVLVGQAAKARVLLSPDKTVSSSKRFMGDRRKTYRVGHKSLTAVNVASMVIKKLVEGARDTLREDIWDAVITVPAYFNEAQREDTRRAGEEAGLNVLRLMPEPTAAALAYGLDKRKDQTIMVYDLGGGTFDVSLLSVRGNKFDVKAVGGDTQLGGDDFDEIMMAWANEHFRAQSGLDLFRGLSRETLLARQRLKEACETAKIELSEASSAVIAVPDCLGKHLELEISRLEFNTLVSPLLQRTVESMKAVLRDAGLRACDVDRVILVGGSTKSRLVQEVVTDEIKEPYVAERVDEVVAHGAAIMASSLFLPEEDMAPIEVTEVTGHTLGIDMLSDNNQVVFRPIIPRQTKYPCRRGFLGSTSRPMQDQVDIHVFRGEAAAPTQNVYLGELSLPVREPEKELLPIGAIFELDADGIIHFTAVQLPRGPALQPIIQFAMERDAELELETVDALIQNGQAHAKTVDISYTKEPAQE